MFLLVFLFSCISLVTGSLLACTFKINAINFILSLGFSSGIMLHISMTESLIKANNILRNLYTQKESNLYLALLFCICFFITLIIDKSINRVNIIINKDKLTIKDFNKNEFIKMFIFMLIAIILHNIPEGLYITYKIKDNYAEFFNIIAPLLMQNLVEGLAIGFTIYCITNNRVETLFCTIIFGISSIVIATLIFLLSKTYFNLNNLSFLMVLSSVLMLYVVFNIITPFSNKYTLSYYNTFIGLILGIITIMLITAIGPYIVEYYKMI